MNCKECNGAGVIVKFDEGHDIFVQEDCITCMLEDKYKQELSLKLAKFLSNSSTERLARTLANLVVEITDNNNLDRIEEYVKLKKTEQLFAMISITGEMNK